ncbi:hypothetical protein ACHAW6_000772 [Cyclotella cf. meneghiniana]
MLRYRRMPCDLYSDTLFCPKVPSARGYMMAQIFVTDFGWSQSYPMSCKSQAHDGLGLLFAQEDAPSKMIVDGAKEMRLREFARKCKEARCYLWGTEPYSAWELKKGAARKPTWSGAPRRLWCFALEYKSYVHLHTAHDIFQLNGHIPDMVTLGETADISPFCEFGFWDWVKFQHRGVAFSDDPLVLGKYLGPIIDVGPALTQHVMKANDKYEDWSIVHQLTPKEPARVHWNHDSNGMLLGTVHQHAMDTRVYEVHFWDGWTKELAANTITEASYAQCDPDCNQHIMLDAIVDYQKDPNMTISCNNQVKMINGKKVVSHSTKRWELRCEWKDGSNS